VFVVGCLGDWLAPAKVLFERESLLRNPPPSRQEREKTPVFSPSSFGNYGEGVGTLRRDGGDLGGGSETLVATNRLVAFGEYADDGTASTLKARDYKDHTDLIVYETHPADSRVKEMGEVCQTVTSRWGTGGGNVPLVQSYSIREDAKANNFSATPLEVTPALQALRPSVQSHHAQTFVAHAFKVRGGCEGGGKGYLGSDEKAFTLSVTQDQQIAFNVNARPDEMKFEEEVSGTLTQSQSPGVLQNMAVRRLTPTECERLQGFPDGYTNIPWRGKPESPDAPRYKAMGNSMAVPVMSWIGKRIQMVEDESNG
jgi:DNA (cytosine-5)-methyltransferase 1